MIDERLFQQHTILNEINVGVRKRPECSSSSVPSGAAHSTVSPSESGGENKDEDEQVELFSTTAKPEPVFIRKIESHFQNLHVFFLF